MNVVRKEETYTIDDIYALPEGERAELIDGKIYYMTPPNTRHQRLVSDLHYQIKDFIKRNSGECEVFPAPLDDKGCHGAPDWIIEIVSPSSKQMDYYKKLFKYRTAGVREYWVVDPDKSIVTVYNFEADTMMEYLFGEDVSIGIYEGFSIKIQ